jgi:hypothetical protein
MKIRLSIVLFVASIAATASADDDHFIAGVKAYKDGNYQEASVQLKQAVAAQPTAQAALYLANSYLKLGRLAQAKRAFNLALQLDPNSPKRDAILALIKDIDTRSPPKPAPAATAVAAAKTPIAAPTPAAPPPAKPAPVVQAAPVPTAPPQPDIPADKLPDVDCPWAPYKEAWACPLPPNFDGGRFATPPDYRQDEVSEQHRRHTWVAGLKVAGARARGRQGVFVPTKEGGWMFVPGPLWSPHDLVTMPAANHSATASSQ